MHTLWFHYLHPTQQCCYAFTKSNFRQLVVHIISIISFLFLQSRMMMLWSLNQHLKVQLSMYVHHCDEHSKTNWGSFAYIGGVIYTSSCEEESIACSQVLFELLRNARSYHDIIIVGRIASQHWQNWRRRG